MPAFIALLLALLAGFGIFQEHLFSQDLWSSQGTARLAWYAVAYWLPAGLILWKKPGWLIPIAAGFTFMYTIYWSGPAAPIAVLFFLGSAYLLGKFLAPQTGGAIATMLGTAVWMTVFWLALHLPVNTRWFYLAALALPYLRVKSPGVWRWRVPQGSLPVAVLLFVLLAYWLLALKPEISSDGLSMHLALPAAVADQGRWPFDFENTIWAVMPSAVDSLYAAVYALAGEGAARLLNFSYLILLAVMIVQGARRWTRDSPAILAAALFASTPLAALVTGSLFIENAWSALLLAGVLALLDEQLMLTGVLLGAALASKLIAAAYVAPVAIIALAIHRRRVLLPALLLIGMGVLPYADAYRRTGNPVFPFSNAVFKSKHYYTDASFDDSRFHAPLTWRTPYSLTFLSAAYMEGRNGAAGFQYLILLIPAMLVARKRDQWIVLAAGVLPTLLILAVLPNLRYLYAALPFLSIAIGWLEWRASAALIALNLWVLPAADLYDRDFALFRKSEIEPYLEQLAPARPLIERLNRIAPGQAVAFFGTDTAAQLHAPVFSDNWHSEHWWKRVRDSRNAAEIRAIFREANIGWVVAPKARDVAYLAVREFLNQWTSPEGSRSGTLEILKVNEAATVTPRDTTPLSAGTYDDLDPKIEYTGSWWSDRQFPQTANQSVTYSNVPGDKVSIRFNGSGISYFYTRAVNRGTAEVFMDGTLKRRIAMGSRETQWQASSSFQGLTPGTHLMEIRVAGGFVDIDQVTVSP